MEVKSVENKEHSAVELVIAVGAEAFDAAINKAYQKQKGKIAIPGFRKGKAPRKIIESMYGASVFYEDAIEELYPTALADAVKEQNLDVVSYPSVEIVSVGKEGFTFKATVTVRPEAKLGAYKGLAAPKGSVEITEKDLERELAPLVERATSMVSVDREAKLGDTVTIDFDGYKDGVPFDGGKGTDYDLELGSHTFVPGFEDALVGVKAGESKDIDLVFPKEYTPELANQPVVFKTVVKDIKEKQLPEMDDEFAKDVSEFETLDELKKDLEEKLRQRRQKELDQSYAEALMKQVCDNLDVEVPDAMVDYRVDEMVQDYAQRVSSQGIPFEDYMKYMGMDVNTLKVQMRPNAVANIKSSLALDAIVKEEGLTLDEEEIQAELKAMSEQYQMEVERIQSLISMDELQKDLLRRKAEKLVVDSGVAEEVAAVEEPAAEAEAEAKPKKKGTTTRKTTTARKGTGTRKKATEEAPAQEEPTVATED